MARSKYARSVAKHIRRQKAFIRRKIQNKEEQEKLIRELMSRFEAADN